MNKTVFLIVKSGETILALATRQDARHYIKDKDWSDCRVKKARQKKRGEL